MRRRSFSRTSTDSRNSSTHIAQGLKPSSRPRANVNSGRPSRSALSVPSHRLSTFCGAGGASVDQCQQLTAGVLGIVEADPHPTVDLEGGHAGRPHARGARQANQLVARRGIAVDRVELDAQPRSRGCDGREKRLGVGAVRATFAHVHAQHPSCVGGARRVRGGRSRREQKCGHLQQQHDRPPPGSRHHPIPRSAHRGLRWTGQCCYTASPPTLIVRSPGAQTRTRRRHAVRGICGASAH